MVKAIYLYVRFLSKCKPLQYDISYEISDTIQDSETFSKLPV